MKILSLFDGMSCGMIAMKLAGLPVDRYDAWEIDKYAVTASKHNFPEIIHHGDVFEADFTEYQGYDFLVGGSPRTYWSIAQNPDKRETTASGLGWDLFSQYVRALHEAQPRMFIYENNKSMSKDIRASITETFGFDPICINSALVSAQNRQRLYWVGVRNADGTYRKASIEQPEDRGILLKDVLDSAIAWHDNDKAVPHFQRLEVNDNAQQTNALTTVSKDNLIIEPVRGPVQIGKTRDSQGCRIYSPEGKSVTLSGRAGGVGANTGLYATQEKDAKGQHVYTVQDGQIEVSGKRYPIKLRDGKYIIRKLTVSECMRLQTVPEWYDFSCVSNTQAYKMLGNGWTCEVIAHLIRGAMRSSIFGV